MVAIVGVFLFAGTIAAQENVRIASDVQLAGLIGSKLKIEMHIICESQQPFFKNHSSDCIDITGQYFYVTQIKPILLKGRLCPANGSFLLSANLLEKVEESERFEGKWYPETKQLKGTWKLMSSGKVLPFTLTAREYGMKESNLQAFYRFLKERMKHIPDTEETIIEDAQWSIQGGKIVGFQPNWGGEIEFLSPTRFKFYSSYTSTARSNYSDELYQLLPSKAGIYILLFSTSNDYERGYEGDPQESDGKMRCSCGISVYKIVNGFSEDVTQSVFPSEVALGGQSDNEQLENCQGTVLSDAVLLPSNLKLYWDGGKFTKN